MCYNDINEHRRNTYVYFRANISNICNGGEDLYQLKNFDVWNVYEQALFHTNDS